MQLWFVGVVIAFFATGASAQLPINITGCTVPCNLAITQADVIIFVDASTGMGQTNIQLIKDALIQWQNPFSIGPSGSSDMLRVALVDYAIYGTAHGLLVENHENHTEMINLINDIKPRSYAQRNLYFGLIEGYTNLDPAVGGMRAGVPKIGMIFSSGTFTGQAPLSAFSAYTRQGFEFYGIAVGINANVVELGTLVGNNKVFHTVNAEQLQYVVGWLLNKACDQTSTVSPVSTASPACCSEGWTFTHNRDRCVTAFSEGLSWSAAAAFCQNIQGQLASIHNAYDNNLFFGFMPFDVQATGIWVGGRTSNPVPYNTTGWYWLDGSAFDYQNWKPGEPDADQNADSIQACLQIFSAAFSPIGQWDDMWCETEQSFICEKLPNSIGCTS